MKKSVLIAVSFLACASAYSMGKSPTPAKPGQWICRWKGGNSYPSNPSTGNPPGSNPITAIGCGTEYKDTRPQAKKAALDDCLTTRNLDPRDCKVTRCTQGADGFCG